MKLTEKQKNTVRLVTDVILSLSLVLTGILFIYSCCAIYKSGPSPFTRESIAAAFSKIAVAVYVTLGIVVVSAVINLVISAEQKKLVGERSAKILVKRLAERADLSGADAELVEAVQKERRLRKIFSWVRFGTNLTCLAVSFVYIVNPANFPGIDANTEILYGLLIYLAFLSPAIIFEAVRVIILDFSYNREAAILKTLPKKAQADTDSAHSCSKFSGLSSFLAKNEKDLTFGIRIALTVCAVVFIVMGIVGGGMVDVLNKAIKICTECIGLG